MKPTLILLAQLQAVDTKLRAAEGLRDQAMGTQRSLQAEVDKLRGEFKTAHARVEDLEKDKRTKEGDLQMEREKLRKWEGRLEDLRNSREFAALSREVEGTRRANDNLTEMLQNQQQLLVEATAQMKDVADRLSAAERALGAESNAVKARLGDMDSQVVGQREDRARLVGKLAPNVVKKYEQLLAKRAGQAVVPAKAGVCTGCNTSVPAQIFIRVQRAESMECCQRCQRILFFEAILDRDPAGAAAAP